MAADVPSSEPALIDAIRAQPELLQVIQGLTTPTEPGLDRLIHERTRLAIMSTLAVVDTLSFGELKDVLGVSDGNLSVHARKLEEAGYVGVNKYFDGRVPKTKFRLTAAGREALRGYLGYMEALIKAMRGQ